MSTLIEPFRTSTALYGGNAAFIEDLYERYLQDPESVDLAWRARFDAMHLEATDEVPHGPVRRNFLRLAQESRVGRWHDPPSGWSRRRRKNRQRSCG